MMIQQQQATPTPTHTLARHAAFREKYLQRRKLLPLLPSGSTRQEEEEEEKWITKSATRHGHGLPSTLAASIHWMPIYLLQTTPTTIRVMPALPASPTPTPTAQEALLQQQFPWETFRVACRVAFPGRTLVFTTPTPAQVRCYLVSPDEYTPGSTEARITNPPFMTALATQDNHTVRLVFHTLAPGIVWSREQAVSSTNIANLLQEWFASCVPVL